MFVWYPTIYIVCRYTAIARAEQTAKNTHKNQIQFNKREKERAKGGDIIA
jgi:hypothetical protein